MKTTNRDRQRRWRQKKLSSGMRTVTIMLPARIKEMIDRHRKETGATIAQIIETAVVHLLSNEANSSQLIPKNKYTRDVIRFSPEKMQQMSTDLNTIAARFKEMTGFREDVTCNAKTVTKDGSAPKTAASDDRSTTEIYRLVRLLNNMEISLEEIALTLNKRKLKTLSGAYEWNAGDVQAVLDDIHQKYGHINPLFSISNAH